MINVSRNPPQNDRDKNLHKAEILSPVLEPRFLLIRVIDYAKTAPEHRDRY